MHGRCRRWRQLRDKHLWCGCDRSSHPKQRTTHQKIQSHDSFLGVKVLVESLRIVGNAANRADLRRRSICLRSTCAHSVQVSRQLPSSNHSQREHALRQRLPEQCWRGADLRTDRPTCRSVADRPNVARMGMKPLGKELVLKSSPEPLTIRTGSGRKTPVTRPVQVKQAKSR